MVETIFWWIFTIAGVFAFFFSYGIVEDLICEWADKRRFKQQRVAPRNTTSPDPGGNGHADSVLH